MPGASRAVQDSQEIRFAQVGAKVKGPVGTGDFRDDQKLKLEASDDRIESLVPRQEQTMTGNETANIPTLDKRRLKVSYYKISAFVGFLFVATFVYFEFGAGTPSETSLVYAACTAGALGAILVTAAAVRCGATFGNAIGVALLGPVYLQFLKQ